MNYSFPSQMELNSQLLNSADYSFPNTNGHPLQMSNYNRSITLSVSSEGVSAHGPNDCPFPVSLDSPMNFIDNALNVRQYHNNLYCMEPTYSLMPVSAGNPCYYDGLSDYSCDLSLADYDVKLIPESHITVSLLEDSKDPPTKQEKATHSARKTRSLDHFPSSALTIKECHEASLNKSISFNNVLKIQVDKPTKNSQYSKAQKRTAKVKKGEKSKENMKEDRKLKNREAALRCRDRKRKRAQIYIESMKTVEDSNNHLFEEIERLQAEAFSLYSLTSKINPNCHKYKETEPLPLVHPIYPMPTPNQMSYLTEFDSNPVFSNCSPTSDLVED